MPSNFRISNIQFQDAKNDLQQYVAIPSVSHTESPFYNPATLKQASEFVGKKLEALGFTVTYPVVNGSAPYVIAQRIQDSSKPIVLIYSHSDVQPVVEEKWQSNPFVLTERNGRVYGRGSSDDKGGFIATLAAIRSLLQNHEILPNIKVFVEPEEEVGSPNMTAFLAQEKNALDADVMVVIDGVNRNTKTGSITSSTRGLVNFLVEVKTLRKPIHSGIGVIAPDVTKEIIKLLNSLEPDNIHGFMEDCEPLSADEKKLLQESSITEDEYAKEMGILPNLQLRGNSEKSVYERLVTEPSISNVNLNCGKLNGGNSIQDSATATVGIRIVAGQKPEKIVELVKNHLISQQINAEVSISQIGKGAWAWKADLTDTYSKMYFEALKENFEQAAYVPCGGSIPMLKEFQDTFPKMKQIVVGVEDNDTSAHSHDESQDLEVLMNAINSLANFLTRVANPSNAN